MNNSTIKREIVNITDAASLEKTIEQLQARVKLREIGLKARLTRLPKEGAKTAASMVLPAVMTTKIAGSSLSAVWNLGKLLMGKKKAIFPLIGSAAKAGLFTYIKKGALALRK